MDFALEETQEELRGLAAQVLAQEAGTERLDQHDGGTAAYDRAAWRAMAQAGLLEAVASELAGGSGLGAVELALILREVGARTAPVPAFATLALGALPISLVGTPEQRRELAPVARGERILTAGIREPGGADPAAPATTARHGSGGYVLHGVKTMVPYAAEAETILVPAAVVGDVAGPVGVFLVPRDAPGLALLDQPTGTNAPACRVNLEGVRVPESALLGGSTDGSAARTLRRYARAGLTAMASGTLAGALLLTTEHVKTRRQFGRALAELQAVTMKVGDIYVASRALDVAMWGAAWNLQHTSHTPDADHTLATACYLVTADVLDALHTAQHLHGGLGVDITYPLHRHFSWAKSASQLLGGAEAQLDILGSLAASDSPAYVLD